MEGVDINIKIKDLNKNKPFECPACKKVLDIRNSNAKETTDSYNLYICDVCNSRIKMEKK